MIVKEEFLNKLRESFGLNIYEVKIWTAMLSRGVSTAGELSDISEVPRSRVYDILESLEKRGFVIMKIGKPIKYIAVKPEDILSRVKKDIKDNVDKKLDQLEKIKETDLFLELKSLHKQGIAFIEPGTLAGAIRVRDNLYDHLDSMLRNAEKSVEIVTTSEGLVRKNALLKRTLRFSTILKLAERGI